MTTYSISVITDHIFRVLAFLGAVRLDGIADDDVQQDAFAGGDIQ